MNKKRIGFALCGSFCTFSQAIKQIEVLVEMGADVFPIMSFNAYSISTRFGKAEEHIEKIEKLCGKKIIASIYDAEPIGPKNLLDLLIIEPCTGNTLGKLANGITDTPVTLAAKAHLRNEKPLLIAVSSNDALTASAANIGKLLNTKNIYFVPMRQDSPINKTRSVVADFSKTAASAEASLNGLQIQPILTEI